MKSLKDRIQEMAGDTEVTDVSAQRLCPFAAAKLDQLAKLSSVQFHKLILDETPLERLTAEDKAYLEQFSELEFIGLNICRLQSLENFPVLSSLVRVSRCSSPAVLA